MRNEDAYGTSHHPVAVSDAAQQLHDFIQNNADSLARTLRLYVSRAGLAKGENVPEVAIEVLQETVVEALKCANRFDLSRQPTAWLLGIAANIIKRRRVKQAISYKYEVAVQDTTGGYGDEGSSGQKSDSELFDRIASLTIKHGVGSVHTKHRPVLLARDDVAQEFDSNESVERLLAQLSPDDQEVVRLAVLEGLDGEALAKRLSVKPVTARVRLHRALKRLRISIEEQQGGGIEL